MGLLADENGGLQNPLEEAAGGGTDLVVAFPALPPPLNSEECSDAEAQRSHLSCFGDSWPAEVPGALCGSLYTFPWVTSVANK